MALISYIRESDLTKYEGLVEVNKLDSVEDVSTLLESFFHTKEEIGYEKIKSVVVDDEGYYYFVESGRVASFDIYEFINRVYKESNVRVSCLNSKYLFPIELSRGIYDDSNSLDDDSTSEQDEDIPTGFLDESKLPGFNKGVPYLVWAKTGANISIPEEGIVLGRSPKKVDFLIKDNINVGRVHCKVYKDEGRLMVHDYKSTNGTFVNNSKVHSNKDVEMFPGDELYLADEIFKVVQ